MVSLQNFTTLLNQKGPRLSPAAITPTTQKTLD